MLPYLILLSLIPAAGICLERYGNQKWNRIFLFSTGILFWLLASLRYQLGFDYQFYDTIFGMVSESDWGTLWGVAGMEPLYLLLNKLVAECSGSYRIFLFLFHGIFLLLLFAFINRRSDIPWLSVYLFLTLQYFALSMNLMRQSMAALIFLLSYQLIREKKLLPFLLLVLAASGFHRSALLMLPLYFLLRIHPTWKSYGILAAAALFVYFTIDPLLNFILPYFPHYQEYLTSVYWQPNGFVYIILPVGQFLFSLFFFWESREEENRVFVNAVYITLLITLFITRHFILERFSIYPSFFIIVALPNLLNATSSSIKQKIGLGICLIGGLAYFLFAVSQGFHDVYPYYGIWDRAGV